MQRHQGKETDFTQARDKEMKIECKLNDKNVAAMLADSAVDDELGVALPGSSKSLLVKQEVHEDVPKIKEMLAEIKSTYFY